MGHQFIPHKFKRQRQLRRDGTLRNIQLDRYFFIRKMLTFTQNKYFLTRRRLLSSLKIYTVCKGL